MFSLDQHKAKKKKTAQPEYFPCMTKCSLINIRTKEFLRVSLYSPGWPGTLNSPASASQVMVLKAYNTHSKNKRISA
jgi:hypothetical protein